MANRFYDNYRPSHDGQNVFGGMINNPRHSDTQKPYSEAWLDHVRKMGGEFGGEGFSNPPGGSRVPRKPKPSKPSGGMKMGYPPFSPYKDTARESGTMSKETMRG